MGKRIVITGATGNVGTSVIEALKDEHGIEEIIAVARRQASFDDPRVSFIAANVVTADLRSIFAGADVVLHLAWAIQPSHDERATYAVNVEGSRRVLDAVLAASVPRLVYASSVGAYSPGPKDRMVDEAWPVDGIPSLFYSRHKAEVERMLDRFELACPEVTVARLRPGLIFKREAATGIRRLFAGPFVPKGLLDPDRIPVVPDIARLRFQAVHSLDVGDAYRRALIADVTGTFNIAADPVLDPETLAQALGARTWGMRSGVIRRAAEVTWHARIQPSPPGWFDLALAVPLMDTGRARRELGWSPQTSATEALKELLQGMHDGADYPTPPLSRNSRQKSSSRKGTKMSESDRPLALVTGAATGIGYELCKVFAENGFDLVITEHDAPVTRTVDTANRLGAEVDVVKVDLASERDVDKLWERIASSDRPLALAAINAGRGIGGEFAGGTALEDELEVIDLNVRSVVQLSKHIVNDMTQRGAGRILFTSSIASTTPGAFQAVYNASKSFVQSFALALRNELKDTGVSVTSLMPGATETNFFERAEMLATPVGSSKKDDPAQVAADGFAALMAGDERAVSASLKTKLQARGSRFMPDSMKAEMHRKMAEPETTKQ
jgi:UDP-glucose 4-epimerase